MFASFMRIDHDRYLPSRAVEGAWNTDEQHIAPALGLLAHVLERDHAGARLLSRISFDILGPLPIEEVAIRTRVLRPGRSIALVEGALSHDGRDAVLARAWFVQRFETELVAGGDLPHIPPVETCAPWTPSEVWPGEFLTTLEVRRAAVAPGRGAFWARPTLPLVAGETVSPTARMLALVDVCNGMNVRVSPDEVLFPNLDLTASVFRTPDAGWIGADTTVSMGPDGRGVTHSVVHDAAGPFGVVTQSLTVRPRRS